MTSDREAFLRTICDYPDDDTPRLVFADWLDEHGGRRSDQKQAEFIRLQIKLATEDPQCDRASEPFKACFYLTGLISPDRRCDRCKVWSGLHERIKKLFNDVDEWAFDTKLFQIVSGDMIFQCYPEIRGAYGKLTAKRGFVEVVECSWEKWLEHGNAILADAPVQDVDLTTAPILSAHVADNNTLFGLHGRSKALIECSLPSDLYRHCVPLLLEKEWPSVRKFTFPIPPEYGYSPLAAARDGYHYMVEMQRAIIANAANQITTAVN